jgi:hypothetical protein
MMNYSIPKICGALLITGGLFTLVVNVGITPFLPITAVESSTIFFWRQVFSLIAALCLTGGVIGIYQGLQENTGTFGFLSFSMVFLGCVFLVAQEWNQIFFVHDFAVRSKDTFAVWKQQSGMSLSDIGSLIALIFFMLARISHK